MLTYIYFDVKVWVTLSHYLKIWLIHQIVLEIEDKIIGPWNIGHNDLRLFWGQMLGHTDS